MTRDEKDGKFSENQGRVISNSLCLEVFKARTGRGEEEGK